ncbi:hypothetical protein ABFS82_01G105600 [Erythranthe guttata]
MQHQQQGGGGGGGTAAGGGGGGGAGEMNFGTDEHQKLGDLGIAEAASPISSRPPAANNNFEEMMRVTAAEGGGGGSGNRWPRQETLALLQIRSEMDAVFRDATLKGPLWEQVSSRKLAELGYQRNAKKCKEKFENVQKYYKRTKETRGGRHDGKSYKFFDQLEALNTSAPSTTTTSENLVHHHHHHILPITTSLPPVLREPPSAPPPPPPPLFSTVGVSFSSSSDEEQEDDEEMEAELGDDINLMMRRKRKRRSGGNSRSSSSEERMMEFLEGVVKQVMQKQESMQQKFLHAIEKREHDRMIREEAWKRQDMARLARQQDLMAQERSISASRDAAIVAFLEKITGQKVNLPHHNPTPPPPPPPTTNNYSMQQLMIPTDKITENSSREMVVAVVPPEKQIQQQHDQLITTGGTGSSSRWPKAEVLALIQLRSGLEHRYQETGLPKGPLWEEISARMKGIGYNRNAKRCKEKWENINKYFKKVKESDKKRPEDTKTCPYFHELDELYRKKVLGNTSGTTTTTTILGGAAAFPEQERHQQDVVGMMSSEDNKNELQASSTLFGEQSQANIGGGVKQPEAMLKKQHNQQGQGIIMMENRCSNKINGSINNGDDDLDRDMINDDEYSYGDENEEEVDAKTTDEEMKMAYKIQFQRQNNNNNVSSSGGETPSSNSFMAMVQ